MEINYNTPMCKNRSQKIVKKLKVHLQLSLFLIKKTVGINSRILKVKYKANE